MGRKWSLFSDMTYEERLQQTLDHEEALREVLAELRAAQGEDPRGPWLDSWGDAR